MQCFGRLCLKASKEVDVCIEHDPPTEQREKANAGSYKRYTVRFGPEIATFCAADDQQMDVPLGVLYRSAQLRESLCSGVDDESAEQTISLPSGVLHSWLISLHELGVLPQRTVADDGAHVPEGMIERSILFLQTADFLHDEDLLDRLFKRVGDILFPPTGIWRQQVSPFTGQANLPATRQTSFTTDADTASDHLKLEKALPTLPVDLVRNALRACKKRLFVHLKVLPGWLHMDALHACFPSITASDSLELHRLRHQEEVDAVAPCLEQLHSLKSLRVSADTRSADTRSPLSVKRVLQHSKGLVQLETLHVINFHLLSEAACALRICLQGMSKLQELNLENSFIEAVQRQNFLAHISCLRRLRVLDLQGTSLGDEGVQAVAQQFSHLSELRRLSLAHNEVSNRGLCDVFANLTFLKLLEDLDVSGAKVHADCLPHVVVPVLPALKHLTLDYIHRYFTTQPSRDDAETGTLLRNSEHFTGLQSLSLRSNAVRFPVIVSIDSILSLRTLIIDDLCTHSDGHRTALGTGIAQLVRLEKLHFRHNWRLSTGKDSATLMQSIAQLQQLTWLTLLDTGRSRRKTFWARLFAEVHSQDLPVPQVEDYRFAELLVSLRRFQKLCHLDISCNQLSERESLCPSVAANVANAVCGFSTLRCLNISRSNLLSAAAVSTLLQDTNLWSLESLDLSHMCGESCRGSEFVLHMSNMTGLQCLKLSGNNFTPAAFSSLSSGLVFLTCLTYLELADCQLKDENIVCLTPALEQLSALREVDLRHNRFKDDCEDPDVAAWGALLHALKREPDLVYLVLDHQVLFLPQIFPEAMQYVEFVFSSSRIT